MLRAVSVPPKGLGRSTPIHAEIELPVGAVEHGEIIDAPAVVSALRQLWRTAKFPTKRVVVGIGSADVVTRQVELPDLDDRDLRSALRFEIADMIPFPVASSVLDLIRIGTFDDDRGVRHARVLSVAALRPALQQIVAITKDAGLKAVAIDLTPFALIRGVSPTTGPADTGAEAIVHLGDRSISVVVHRGGVPHFTRSFGTSATASGGASELGAELELIEQYIQRSAGPERGAATSASADPVVSAIHGTLEYYALQTGATPVSRITLTGENSWAARIAPAIASLLDVAVGVSDPLSPEATYQASPFIAATGTSSYTAAYGLAQPPGNDVVGPAVLHLLPGKDGPRSWWALGARSLGATVAAAAVLTGIGVVAGPDPGAAQTDARAAEAQLSSTKAELRALDTPLAESTELANLERHQRDVAKLQIDWHRILGAIRTGFPPDATLLSLTAKAPTSTRTGSTPGSIQLSGQTTSQASLSALLVQLSGIPGVTNPWLGSARAGTPSGDTTISTFSITMELDDQATVLAGERGGK